MKWIMKIIIVKFIELKKLLDDNKTISYDSAGRMSKYGDITILFEKDIFSIINIILPQEQFYNLKL